MAHGLNRHLDAIFLAMRRHGERMDAELHALRSAASAMKGVASLILRGMHTVQGGWIDPLEILVHLIIREPWQRRDEFRLRLRLCTIDRKRLAGQSPPDGGGGAIPCGRAGDAPIGPDEGQARLAQLDDEIVWLTTQIREMETRAERIEIIWRRFRAQAAMRETTARLVLLEELLRGIKV